MRHCFGEFFGLFFLKTSNSTTQTILKIRRYGRQKEKTKIRVKDEKENKLK